MISTYATQITKESIPHILEDVAKWGLQGADDLDGAMEEAANYGTTSIAILSVNSESRHATFTTMWETDFNKTWFYDGATHGEFWKRIQLTNTAAR